MYVREALPRRRHRQPPELPRLDELLFSESPWTTRSSLVQTVLRQTALQNRNDHFQPFYSIRAVADHFHLPPATVSRIYHRLSSERLLRMVWGSRTLLEPTNWCKKRQPRTIGIPVAVFQFVKSPDYRRAVLNLQREIWNHGIAEHLIFFENSEEEILQLCKRHHFSDIDTVIWMLPDISNKQTLLRLQDIGIHIICIGPKPISGIHEFYRTSRGYTIGNIVRDRVLRLG
jgi:hypothetical protein